MHDSRTPVWVPALVLLVALVPLGARGPAASALVVFLIALAFVVTTVRCGNENGYAAAPSILLEGVRPSALLAFAAIAGLQRLSWSLVGFGAGPVDQISASVALLGAGALFYLLAADSASSPAGTHRWMTVLVALGALEALYGLLNLLAGNERLLIYERWAYPDSVTGTLVNRNHFAYLMEMSLPLAVAWAMTPMVGDSHRPIEERARRLVVGSAAVTMSLALLFSGSRMGIASLALASGVVALAARILAPQPQGIDRSRTAGLIVAALVTVAFATVIGLDPVLERFAAIPQDVEQGRAQIWQATLSMALERPLLGHGWGTFESLLPAYRPQPTGVFFSHAHNEYLQVFAEAGIVGLGAVAWLLYLFVVRAAHALAAPAPHGVRTLRIATIIAVTSVLFHCAADFGLRVPGVGLTFVAMVALFVRMTTGCEPAPATPSGERQH